jgi:hypothetical protein
LRLGATSLMQVRALLPDSKYLGGEARAW